MKHDIHRHTLPNGISLVLIPLQSTEAVTSIVLMGVGSRYESDAQRGLAHFTEHMVFKGGKTFLDAQAISQALDAVGGEFNAFTSQEFTGFYTKTASRHMKLGLDVLSDMVLHASIPDEELQKEKGVIVEEINMYEDIPMRKVDHLLSELLFGDTPLGRPILGTKESVTGFTRQDFIDYRTQFYFGSQCTIVIAGAIDEVAVKDLVQELFAELPKGQTYLPTPVHFMDGPKVLLQSTDSQQSHLMLAVKGYALAHPKRFAYRILATILGGNMSSRLFTSVREQQGLCYYVRATPDTYVDCGVLACSAGVDNNRLHKAITAILHELTLLRDQPVLAEELERAKQFQLGKLLLSLEDSEEVAEFYGMQELLEHSLLTPDEIEAGILSVTVDEIQAIAQELFTNDNLRLAVVGPEKDAATLEKLLVLV